MGPDTTFFNYSRADSDFVLKLARDLRRVGADVWLDQMDIKSGDRWDLSVEKALKDSSKLVVILSPASVASDNVMDEVSFALEEHKTVIPVLFKPCAIPFRLRRLQHSDFTVNYNEGLENLLLALGLKDLIHDLHGKDDPGPASEEPQESEKEQKLKGQAEVKRVEEQIRIKEQAEKAKIEQESANITITPSYEKAKYKTPVIIAVIIAILLIVIWFVNTGTKNNPAEIQDRNDAKLYLEQQDQAADTAMEVIMSDTTTAK